MLRVLAALCCCLSRVAEMVAFVGTRVTTSTRLEVSMVVILRELEHMA